MSHNAIPSLDDTLGAVEIGGVCSTLLFRIATLQTFYYYGQFATDPKLLKSTCSATAILNLTDIPFRILELGHIISTWSKWIYSMTVTFYGQSQYIQRPPHSLDVKILFSVPINCMVQGMYNVLVVLVLSLGVSADIIIAISLCYCPRTMRMSGVGDSSSDRLSAAESGMATGGCSVIVILLYLLRSDLTFLSFHLILAKLLSNSFLASLNGRLRFRGLKGCTVNLNTGPHPSATSPSIFVAQPNRGMTLDMSPMTVADFNLSKVS
ncbi:hypothetical protein C8J57DRAFT_1473235 [Mycena rebaudengoi]|nr:hypothetical protein C8J57DRAFT_1473235 [Mycena rebaudengoi]